MHLGSLCALLPCPLPAVCVYLCVELSGSCCSLTTGKSDRLAMLQAEQRQEGDLQVLV